MHARETECEPPWHRALGTHAVRPRSAGCRRCLRTRSYSVHRGAHRHVRLGGGVNRVAGAVPQRPAAAGARVALGSTRHGLSLRDAARRDRCRPSRGVSPRSSDVSRGTHAFSGYSSTGIPSHVTCKKRWEYTTYVFTQLPQVARNLVRLAVLPALAVKSGRRWRSAEGLVHAHRVMMRLSE